MFKSLFSGSTIEKRGVNGGNKWKNNLAANSLPTSSASISDEILSNQDIPSTRMRHSFSHPNLMSALEEEQNTHDDSELSINPFESPLLKRSKSLPFNLVKQPSISNFRRKEAKSVRFESTGKENTVIKQAFQREPSATDKFIIHSSDRSGSSEYSDSPKYSENENSEANPMFNYKVLNKRGQSSFMDMNKEANQEEFMQSPPKNCDDDKWFERITKDSRHLNLRLMSQKELMEDEVRYVESDSMDFDLDEFIYPATNEQEKNTDIGLIVGLKSFENNATKDKSFTSNIDKSILLRIAANFTLNVESNDKINCESTRDLLEYILDESLNWRNEIFNYKQDLQSKEEEISRLIASKQESENREEKQQKKIEELRTSMDTLKSELNAALNQPECNPPAEKRLDNEGFCFVKHIEILKQEKSHLLVLNKSSQEMIKDLESQISDYERMLLSVREGIKFIASENESLKISNQSIANQVEKNEIMNKSLSDSICEYDKLILEKNAYIEVITEKLKDIGKDFIKINNEANEAKDFKKRYEIQKAKYDNLLNLNKEIEKKTSKQLESTNEELKKTKLALDKASESYSKKDFEREALITNMTKYSNDLRYKNSELTDELIQVKENMSILQSDCINTNKKYEELNEQNSKSYKILQYYDDRIEELTILRENEKSELKSLEESYICLRENFIKLVNTSFESLLPVMYEETSAIFKKMLEEFRNKELLENNDKTITQNITFFIIDTVSDLVKKFLSNKTSLEREINNRNINYEKMLAKLEIIMEENLNKTSNENFQVVMNNDLKEPKYKKRTSKHRHLLPKN